MIRQLAALLPPDANATLLAVDGHVTHDVVERQINRIPDDATHLVVSVGGNDALGQVSVLQEPTSSVGESLQRLAKACEVFEENYGRMVDTILSRRRPVALCTIYDTGFPEPYRTVVMKALALFNDVITRAAFSRRLDLVDLRLICDDPADFANPIEPSSIGGQKIAEAIARFVASSRGQTSSRVWL